VPHHQIVAALLVLFFSALTHPAFAQNARTSKCPPAVPPLECEVRKATDDYFALLEKKDWGALSQMGLETRYSYEIPRQGENLSLRLLEQLLGPLKIETMTYTVSEVSADPDEVKVRYTMQLRATVPRSGKTAINVSGAQRVLEWKRGFCNCPETGMSAWMLKRDAFSPDGLADAYLRARTDEERKFILNGLEKPVLEETAGELQRQGIELINSENYRGAFNILKQAQDIHDKIKYQERLSSQLDVEDYERRIKEAGTARNGHALASLLKDAAGRYAELKESGRARSYLETSLRLFKEANDGVSVAEVYKELAELQMEDGDYLSAVAGLQKSVDQYLDVVAAGGSLNESATSDLADAAGELFLFYELQGHDDDAARVVGNVQKALPDEYKALFMFGRGLFQWLRGQSSPAFDNNEKAFELLGKLPRTESGDVEGGLAGVSIFLSLAYSMQGDHTKAAINLRRAKEVILKWKTTDPEAAEMGDMPEVFVKLIEALFYGAEGSEEVLLSHFEKVIPQISAAASDVAQPQLPLGEIDVPEMLNLASMEYLRQEKYETALQCLFQALSMAEASEDKMLPALIHQHLAFVYAARGDNAKAQEHFETSLRLNEELHAPLYAAAIGRLMAGVDLLALASAYEEAGNYAAARTDYQKLLEMLGPFVLINPELHKDIAETYYAEHRYDEAISELDKGIAIAKSVGMRYFLWELYQLSGRTHWANNEPALARRDLEASIAEVEAMRRTVVGGEVVIQRFFEDKLSPYHDLIELLLQQGNCDEAFAYAERSKSRALLDVLKRGRKYTRNFMSPAEQGEEASLRRKLIMLNRRVEQETYRESGPGRLDTARGARAEARLDYELFRAGLYVAHPELATAPVQEAVKVEELRDLLPSPDTALLEYVVTGYNAYLFVVTSEADPRPRGGPGGAPPLSPKCRAYPLEINGGDLEEAVSDFRVRVSHPEGVLQKQARGLYDVLLRPAQQQLDGKKTLVIVPDGVLWDMPFQALKPKADRYLLQDSVIYYAPSFTALREMRRARYARAAGTSVRDPGAVGDSAVGPRQGLTLLAVGNPVLSGGREALQGTGDLAKRLEALYGKANTRVYTGAEADEERIKNEAGSYKVIHIGTHGVLDNQNPLYSYVLLSQGQQEGASAASSPEAVPLDLSRDLSKDGLLEAWEIMDLDLNAQLVVLSACETARGRVGDGEGLVGLSWALFIAGSPATVASQWKVDEQGTNELMYSFHKNFVSGVRTAHASGAAAAALQQASLKLLESSEYKHPYYWAGFVLIGDGS
jgi:CHAT domain-containing protein/tetratricopeptide (TPR) repeat protein